MSGAYPIYDISAAQPEWIEPMGSKRKFWFRWSRDGDAQWLFKFSREGTGEDWAEKIACELAAALALPCARIELASFEGARGSVSRRFVRQDEGWELVHGNEILFPYVPGYNRDPGSRESRNAGH